ncbi:MAG TPA: bifunctional nuclease family protein [bacterium]|nr:bifunctional nuclease family protein [bacterium]
MDLVEVELSRVVIHQKGDQQYIHLRERHGPRGFPIVIGYNEVEEINRKLCGVETQRPLTHDLVGRILSSTGYRLHRVIISELREGTFYATLVLRPRDEGTSGQTGERTVDCRPSDAIALAVQTGATIHVAREVFEAVAVD